MQQLQLKQAAGSSYHPGELVTLQVHLPGHPVSSADGSAYIGASEVNFIITEGRGTLEFISLAEHCPEVRPA